MGTNQYTRGVHDIGHGCFAYLQPDGSWGWSNAGLITDGDAALLVDTLYDLRTTADMLSALKAATRAADRIDTVVNTHANGDHCYGNQLVSGAKIISTRATAEEIPEVPPQMAARLLKLTRLLSGLPWPLSEVPAGKGMASISTLGRFFIHCFGAFEFEGITLTLPNTTFSGQLELKVGDRDVQLIEVGPAHTRGDLLVYVPSAKTVYTGDILFIDGHPIVWDGPIGNWIDACDRILEMDVETVVPGHGPITDKAGVRRVKRYLEYVRDEARARHAAGMSVREAARDISLTEYAGWSDAERIGVNVSTVYRELEGRPRKESPFKLFALMATLANDRRR